MLRDKLFTSTVQAKVVDFRIHDFGETFQDFRIRHIDLVQEDPFTFLLKENHLVKI